MSNTCKQTLVMVLTFIGISWIPFLIGKFSGGLEVGVSFFLLIATAISISNLLILCGIFIPMVVNKIRYSIAGKCPSDQQWAIQLMNKIEWESIQIRTKYIDPISDFYMFEINNQTMKMK